MSKAKVLEIRCSYYKKLQLVEGELDDRQISHHKSKSEAVFSTGIEKSIERLLVNYYDIDVDKFNVPILRNIFNNGFSVSCGYKFC